MRITLVLSFDLDARHRVIMYGQLIFGGWGGGTLVEDLVLQLLLLLIWSKGGEPLCNDEPTSFFCFFWGHTHVDNLKVPCLRAHPISNHNSFGQEIGWKGFLCSRHYFSTHFEKNPHLAVAGAFRVIATGTKSQYLLQIILQSAFEVMAICWSGSRSLLRILWCSQSQGDHS